LGLFAGTGALTIFVFWALFLSVWAHDFYRALDAIKALLTFFIGTAFLAYGWLKLRVVFFDGRVLPVVLSCFCFGLGGGMVALGVQWLHSAFGPAKLTIWSTPTFETEGQSKCERKVSFVYGQLQRPGLTKEDVRKALAASDGEGDARKK